MTTISAAAITGPVVVDANILIALLDPTNVHHEAVRWTLDRITPAVEFDTETKAQRTVIAYMHPLNMAEVLRGYEPAARARVLELVESPQVGIVAEPIRDPAAEALMVADYADRGRGRGRMPDACVLALASASRLPLLTTDEPLAAVARAAGGLRVLDLLEPEQP